MNLPLALASWQAALWAVAVAVAVWAAFVAGLYIAGRGPAARALARLIPDMLVLFKRLLGDARVPRRAKVALALCVGYLALPFDLVPDFIPVAGQLDDAVIVGLVLRFALRSSGPQLVTEHWPGPQESLDAILRLMRPGERRSLAWLWTLVFLIVFPLIAFLLLAEDVWNKEVISWDTSILSFTRGHRDTLLNPVVRVYTNSGSGPFVLVMLAVAFVVLWRAGRRRDAWFAAVGTIGSMLLDLALKDTFDRPRPGLIPTLITTPNNYSFPSGHTMSAMGFVAVVVVLTWDRGRRWWVAALALLWAISIGLSRVYLGVHYPSDVAAGWLLSIAWVSATKLLLDAWWRDHDRRSGTLRPDAAHGKDSP